MIEYSAGDFCAALRRWEVVRLTNFRSAAAIATLSSGVTLLLVVADVFSSEPHFRNLGIDPGPYSVISGVLGLLLSFRTGQAYNRFWSGATAVYDVTGGLYMAASNLVAFAYYGNTNSREDIEVFKQTTVRLISVLSAMMLADLEGYDPLLRTDFEILDVGALQSTLVRSLLNEANKTEVVIQWLKTFIIENISNGMLSVPPPILSRVFQELDVSMGCYHSASKLGEVPFSFPYVATLDLIMIIHTSVTVVVMMSFFSVNRFLPIPTVFIIVFCLWSIHLVAGELENPFNGDMNDLDLFGLQCELNEKLKATCTVRPESVPKLSTCSEQASLALASTKPGRLRQRRKTVSAMLSAGRSVGSGMGDPFRRAPTERPGRTDQTIHANTVDDMTGGGAPSQSNNSLHSTVDVQQRCRLARASTSREDHVTLSSVAEVNGEESTMLTTTVTSGFGDLGNRPVFLFSEGLQRHEVPARAQHTLDGSDSPGERSRTCSG